MVPLQVTGQRNVVQPASNSEGGVAVQSTVRGPRWERIVVKRQELQVRSTRAQWQLESAHSHQTGTELIRMKIVLTTLACLTLAVPAADAQNSAIDTLKAKATTPKQAQAAMQKLSTGGPDVLVPILDAMQGTNPVTANWLRGAFEDAASKVLKSGSKLPAKLTGFVEDRTKDGRARRLAYDWMLKTDPSLAERAIPAMLFDPVPEFRRDAIELLLKEGTKQLDAGENDAAKKTFQKALSAAIHDDQVKQIIKPLEKLGTKVDLQKHFGFLPAWSVVGPFNNKEGVGFAAVHPPEKDLNLAGEFDGESGKVKWKKFSTDDSYGNIDIAKLMENFKGSCIYATTEFKSDRAQELEIRLATPNAWKLWINGELVFGREEYHRTPNSLVMDVYQVPAKLKAGSNRILLKICQNEQEQSWAQRYQFNLRVCDKTGTAVREGAAQKSASTNR